MKMTVSNKTLLILVVLLTLTGSLSCSKQSENTLVNDGIHGYLNLQLSRPEIEIQTRTPISDDYQIVIRRGTEEVLNSTYGEILSPMMLTPGDYSVYAQNLTAEAALKDRGGRGNARFYGAQNFVIRVGELTDVTFQCKMLNTRVSVGYEQSFKDVFEDVNVTIYDIKDENRKLNFDKNASIEDKATFAYFDVHGTSSEMIVVISVQRQDGKVDSQTRVLPLNAGSWHKIMLSSDSTDGQVDMDLRVDDTMAQDDQNMELDPFGSLEK